MYAASQVLFTNKNNIVSSGTTLSPLSILILAAYSAVRLCHPGDCLCIQIPLFTHWNIFYKAWFLKIFSDLSNVDLLLLYSGVLSMVFTSRNVFCCDHLKT